MDCYKDEWCWVGGTMFYFHPLASTFKKGPSWYPSILIWLHFRPFSKGNSALVGFFLQAFALPLNCFLWCLIQKGKYIIQHYRDTQALTWDNLRVTVSPTVLSREVGGAGQSTSSPPSPWPWKARMISYMSLIHKLFPTMAKTSKWRSFIDTPNNCIKYSVCLIQMNQ